MSVLNSVKQYLDNRGMSYEILTHREVFTTTTEALETGVPSNKVAKTLVIKIKSGEMLAVLPANERIDMHKLRSIVDDNKARLATEEELGAEFTDLDLGAVPPLGDLFQMPVVMDSHFREIDEVIFASGTHRESFRVSGDDFINIARPLIADLADEQGEEMLY